MALKGLLATIGLVACVVMMNGSSSPQSSQTEPSLPFGIATISLGMTVEQVNKTLTEYQRHLQFFPNDKENASVIGPEGDEGQIRFSAGRATYAAYHMPNVTSADELTQEIAGAVETMETKNCTAHNFSGHGTGGRTNQTIFQCGSDGSLL